MTVTVGTVLTLPGATAAELLAEPFDFVWIDLEHGALDRSEAQEMILGAQATGCRALVRLPASELGLISAMLDAGADGVVLADVRSADVASLAASQFAHPPDGNRGYGPRRAGLRHRTSGGRPPQPTLWAQIEHSSGVEASRAIASIVGIDALVVGLADLSFALGDPLNTSSPDLLQAVSSVRSASDGADTAFGVAGALDTAPAGLYDGATILVHSTDARLCARAVDDAASWLRSAVPAHGEAHT